MSAASSYISATSILNSVDNTLNHIADEKNCRKLVDKTLTGLGYAILVGTACAISAVGLNELSVSMNYQSLFRFVGGILAATAITRV